MILKKGKKYSSRIINITVSILGVLSTITGLACIGIKAPDLFFRHKNNIQLFATGLAFPSSNENIFEELKKKQVEYYLEDPSIPENNSQPSSPNPQTDDNQEYDEPVGDEKTYKIIESQLGASGTKYHNFYVKNSINSNVNIEKELSSRPDINIKKDGSPQVLIYHTHTTESYMKKDQKFYYESFYPRSSDNNFNVTQVGNNISDVLISNGIGVIHDLTTHDNPTYNGSYSRSIKTIKKNLEEHPSIQVTIDIHRDSLGGNDSGKIKPTFKVNNKKAAQIMIMSGCDQDGSLGFPDWKDNLRFALKLHSTAETMYPGMTRPMFLGAVKYNMHMTHGSILIEVGSDVNTLDEAKYTGSLLGNALSKVLCDLA